MGALKRVLIIGGGIGGLTAYTALRRQGYAVRVVERAPAFEPVGAGIAMGFNAMKVFRALGLADAIAGRGHPCGLSQVTDEHGRVLTSIDISALSEELGDFILIHRAKLHEALLTEVDDNDVVLGTTPESIEQNDDGVDITLSNGDQERFDLVVGADGLRSQVREMVFGDIPLRYSGYTCWRFVVSGDFGKPMLTEMWGRGRRFGVVPIGANEVYCYTTLNAPHASEAMRDISLEDYKKLFADFGGRVPAILDVLTDRNQLIWNDLEEIHVPRWVDGRVVLLGDAAHGMTPNMGQGAAMAIEDAAALGAELAAPEDWAAGLARYEEARKARAGAIQRQSFTIGRVGQFESGAACFLRNLALRLTPSSVGVGQIRKLTARTP